MGICHPRKLALVLTENSLHVYEWFWGGYCALPWKQIEAFEPFAYNGHITYYIVLKDYEVYYQQVPSLCRRFILWTDGLILRCSVNVSST